MDIDFIIKYLFAIIILITGMFFYIKLADRYNIIDKPNARSSHSYITIRGGGIVFWLAGAVYFAFNFPESLYFFIGLTLICTVSLWDDISSLPNRIRIVIHFAAISLAFHNLGIFALFPWWMIVPAFILFAGILNAYNFMDGINGITGLCSLSVLIPLWYVNERVIPFTDTDFILFPVLACIVFLFFNFRKRAKCFAGDVGSMAVSFWIVTLLLQLMIKDESFVWIFFLSVYGVDSVCTILYRLYLRQNIFQAHRLHFYQMMTGEWNISHRKVASFYALTQLLICSLTVYFHEYRMQTAIVAVVVLLLVYMLRFRKNCSPN